MIILDAQLSPDLAAWIGSELKVHCVSVREIGLRDAEDELIFNRARQLDAVVITKDVDFVTLLERYGPPPRVVWLTCGNTSAVYLRVLLLRLLPQAIESLRQGESLVEIGSL